MYRCACRHYPARHVYNHTLGYASRDVDFNHFFTLLNAGATAVLTLIFYHHAFAAAGRAYALLLHHTEDALGGMSNDTLSVTGGTGLLAATSLGTRAVTVGASDVLAYLELLGDTLVDFL